MAFNPFHTFRRYQKSLFVVLMIVCMITFVFSFGPGDLFSRDWFGTQQGETVATLYDDDVTENQLYELDVQRRFANRFVLHMFFEGLADTTIALIQQQTALNTIDQPGMQGAVFQVRQPNMDFLNIFQRMGSDPKQLQAARPTIVQLFERFPPTRQDFSDPRQPGRRVSVTYSDLRASLENLRQAQLTVTLKPEQARALTELIRFQQYQLWSTDPNRHQDDFFLGGRKSAEGLLEFMMWKEQADKLGIDLNEETVIQLVNSVSHRQILQESQLEENPMVVSFLQAMGQQQEFRQISTLKDLHTALADEFRVMLAKEALLGIPPPAVASGALEYIYASPAKPTPLEFLQYYRKQRTTLALSVLALPVENYRDLVEKQPDESTLEELFEKYKDVEPHPQLDRPAFKEPRRIRAEYISIDANSSRYQERAKQVSETYKWFSSIPVFSMGGNPMVNAATATLPWVIDVPLVTAYHAHNERTSKDIESWTRYLHVTPFGAERIRIQPLHDKSVLREGPSIAVTGMAFGNAMTMGTSFSTALGWISSASVYENAERERVYESYAPAIARAVAVQLGAPTFAGVGGVFSIATLPLGKVHEVEPINRAFIEPRLREDVLSLSSLREALRTGDLEELEKEIKGLGKLSEPKAREQLSEILKKYEIAGKPKTMETARDVFSLPKDPALEELKDSFVGGDEENKLRNFLFGSTGTYQPSTARGTDPDGYLAWRIEDHKAYIPKSYQDARANVETAWYRLQARQLAREKAEEIKEKILALKAKQAPGVTVQNLREEGDGEVFDLEDVARLIPDKTATSGIRTYGPYVPPNFKIQYPDLTMVPRLMEMTEPGDAAVFWDQPKKHYYVGVLLTRSVPTLEDFTTLYRETPTGDSLWTAHFMPDVRTDYRDALLKQMRIKAGAADDKGNWKMAKEFRERFNSASETR